MEGKEEVPGGKKEKHANKLKGKREKTTEGQLKPKNQNYKT